MDALPPYPKGENYRKDFPRLLQTHDVLFRDKDGNPNRADGISIRKLEQLLIDIPGFVSLCISGSSIRGYRDTARPESDIDLTFVFDSREKQYNAQRMNTTRIELLTRAHELIPGTYLHFGFLDVGAEQLPVPPEVPHFGDEQPIEPGAHPIFLVLRNQLRAERKAFIESIIKEHRHWNEDTLEAYVALTGVSTGTKILKARRKFKRAIQLLPKVQRNRFINEAADFAANKEHLSYQKIRDRIGSHFSSDVYIQVRTLQWRKKLTHLYNPSRQAKNHASDAS